MGRPLYGNIAPVTQAEALAAGSLPGAPTNSSSMARTLDRFGISQPKQRQAQATQREAGNFAVTAPDKRIASDQQVDDSFVNIAGRRPFVLTCQKWIAEDRYIYCRVNPESCQWTEGLRISEQQTLAGTVQHAWRQRKAVNRSTFFSEPTVAITFQSGNIMPVRPVLYDASISYTAQKKLPAGLKNFYEFKALLNEARIVDDETADRRANVVYIMYTSQVYPSIVLAGMFQPDGLTWTDDANDPNQVKWSSTFTVFDSFPAFDSGVDLISSWYLVDKAPEKPQAETGQDAGRRFGGGLVEQA